MSLEEGCNPATSAAIADIPKIKWLSKKDRKKELPINVKLRDSMTRKAKSQPKLYNYDIPPDSRKQTSVKRKKKNPYACASELYEDFIDSPETILKDRKIAEEQQRMHELIQQKSKKFRETVKKVEEVMKIDIKKKKMPKNLKHCKDLTKSEVKELFAQNVEFLDDIYYDRKYNARHEIFKTDTPHNNGTDKDLRINEAALAFEENILTYIVKLFRRRYIGKAKSTGYYNKDNFFYKVLLPEYSLKIFCDIHEMITEEGLAYLKSIPVPDLI